MSFICVEHLLEEHSLLATEYSFGRPQRVSRANQVATYGVAYGCLLLLYPMAYVRRREVALQFGKRTQSVVLQ